MEAHWPIGIRWPSLGLIIFFSVALILALPAVASGASRYAAPSGSGATCTQPSPCALATAITGAGAGDDIFIDSTQGDYSLGVGIDSPAGVAVHLHGMGGRPRLVFSGGGLRLKAGTAENLEVRANSTQTAFSLATAQASADRMFVQSGSTDHACYLSGGTLTNSVCWAGSAGDLAIETDASNTLRNVTAVGGSEAAIKAFARNPDCACATATDTFVNVIARSAASGTDIELVSDGSAVMSVTTNHSNYATNLKTGAGAPGMTQISGTSDQTTTPVFADATAGNFAEAPSSATIDAGLDDPSNGTLDLAGNPREQNGTTDIGAYEFSPSSPGGDFTFGKLRLNKKKGTAVLSVVVTAGGQLTLSGKNVKTAKQQAAGAGEVKLAVKAAGKTAKRLKKKGKAKVKVSVTFTPAGGVASSKSKSVKLKRKR